MSFMVNPHPYDDVTRVNKLDNSVLKGKNVITNLDNIHSTLAERYTNDSFIFDYYLDASCLDALNLNNFSNHVIQDVREFLIDEDSFFNLIDGSLPMDLVKDPYLLFGKIHDGLIDEFFNKDKVANFFNKNEGKNILLYGVGAASKVFRSKISNIVYFDRTPKDLSLLVSKEAYTHINALKGTSFNEKLRQFYYVDMMVAMRLRKELISDNLLDLYITKNPSGDYSMLEWDVIENIFANLIKKPITPKPIYLPGVWGGEYIKTVRNLHKHIEEKIAWVFEFIPLESSVGVVIDELYIDFPFYSLLNSKEEEILGKAVAKKFDGFFPVRVNYDDTWHGDGNMSIQVHPGEEYIKENYNEYGSQDEAYYIVTTGHDAVTYAGLNMEPEQFLKYCEESYENKTLIDYKEFVNYFESKPGKQFMIPGGTLHSSGRNQLVLEHGSLTVGSYTYKVYDYVRKDLQGNPRPIHIYKGNEVLTKDQNREWAEKTMLMEPMTLNSNENYAEKIIGKNDTMYYETHRIELGINKEYTGFTNDEFALLVLVDGDKIRVSDADDNSENYEANYLDVLIIPASMKEYRIEALGYQPVMVHKTVLQ